MNVSATRRWASVGLTRLERIEFEREEGQAFGLGVTCGGTSRPIVGQPN